MKYAFTLIEIIIVITITIVLAALGIGAYHLSRQQIIVDLETDRIIAKANSLRDLAQRGNACHGIRFSKTGTPQEIETAYLNPIAGCSEEEKTSRSLNVAKNINMSSVKLDDGEKESLLILWEPPQGTIHSIPPGKKAVVEVFLDTAANAVRRRIIFNTLTGAIEKLKP